MYKCQYCTNPNIDDILFLGSLPPVNDMHESALPPVSTDVYALPFCHCSECGLTQIGIALDKEVVFPRSYPYLSGVTKSLLFNFQTQASEVADFMKLNKSDLVVDIGSNDGSLLKFYSPIARVLGVEPTQAADIANKNGIETINAYFDSESASMINSKFGKAKVITACNVFAHIDNIDALLDNIIGILEPDGIFISESHYLLDLVETLQFDTIYHEHLRYYTVTFLKNMLESKGFRLFRVDPSSSHGGSIRVWATKSDRIPIDSSVNKYLKKEFDAKITTSKALREFASEVVLWRNEFRLLISKLKINNATISALGAPSRASTLIAFSGVTELDIASIGEIAGSAKIGKDLPGTRIPVILEDLVLAENPSHLLVLSWHIKNVIIKVMRDKGYRGKFIIPLPTPTVVD